MICFLRYRSTVFFRLTMLSLLLGVGGSELGAFLLDKGVYLSYKALLPATLIVFPILYFVPETLYLRKTGSNILIEEPDDTSVPADIATISHSDSFKKAISNLRMRLHKFRVEYVANMSVTAR